MEKRREKRGKNMWMPPVLIDEIKDIQKEEGLDIKTEAMRKLVKYARVGREVKNMKDLSVGNLLRKRTPVDDYFKKKKKRKQELWHIDL